MRPAQSSGPQMQLFPSWLPNQACRAALSDATAVVLSMLPLSPDSQTSLLTARIAPENGNTRANTNSLQLFRLFATLVLVASVVKARGAKGATTLKESDEADSAL